MIMINVEKNVEGIDCGLFQCFTPECVYRN
jgi:hypothetical protein